MFEGNSLDDELAYINSRPVDERGVFTGPSITYHSTEPFSDRSYTDVLADYRTNKRHRGWNWSGDPNYYKHMAEWKRQHPYQNMMYDALSLLPASPLAIPLFEGAGAAYSILPSAAQGGLNLWGAVEGYNDFTKNTAPLLKDSYNRGDWKDFTFNTGRSLLDLTGFVGGATPAVTKGLNAANHYVVRPTRAGLKFAINARPNEIPGFWDNLKLDWRNPEVNVIDAINHGRYRMSVNTSANQARKLRETAENTFNEVLNNIANKLSNGQDANKINEL